MDRIVEEPASRSMLGRKLTAKATELDGQVILDDLGRRCVTRSVARQLFAERVEAEQRRREVERQREADAIELEARNRPRGGVPVYNPLVAAAGVVDDAHK